MQHAGVLQGMLIALDYTKYVYMCVCVCVCVCQCLYLYPYVYTGGWHHMTAH